MSADSSYDRSRTLALAALASRGLPMRFVVKGDDDAWPFVARALLSRAASTARSIDQLHESGQKTDATILLRSLYEHVVHFAWLAAQPDAARIAMWRKNDLRQRLAADEDTRTVGIELLTDDQRCAMQREKDALAGAPVKLIDIAGDADDYWSTIFPNVFQVGKRSSLRGFYALLYRHYSKLAHPTMQGLNPVTIGEMPDPRLTVKVEDSDSEGADPYGMVSVILGMMLYVASESLGDHEHSEINKIFDLKQ